MTTLGDLVVEAQSGFACGKEDQDGIFQFRMHNVSKESALVLDKRRRVPRDAHKKLDQFLVRERDVMFNATNSPDGVGKSILVPALDEPAVFSNHFLRLRPDPQRLDAAYLWRWLQYRFKVGVFSLMARQWVNQATVDRTRLLGLPFALPALEEQRRIAAILDQADALRTKRRQSLAHLDDLTQSIFHAMFGSTTATVRLGDLCRLYSGGTPSKKKPELWAGDLPWFSAKDLKATDLWDSQDHIAGRVPEETSIRLLPANTIALVVRGMILAHSTPVSVIRVPATINQDLKALLPQSDTQVDFLASALRARTQWILARVATAAHGTKRLETTVLESVPIPDVARRSQDEFAARVANIKSQRTAVECGLAADDELFSALQSRAFSRGL
ncbi:restriction endonuclease subunit S [Pseudactinotalea sp. Z1739]|uniref:restriction endonuclease subunit S n=1 Tax=Pseudactinotalea sp. Z1739 TaxID=3413028 RepID=UPI003C7D5D2C